MTEGCLVFEARSKQKARTVQYPGWGRRAFYECDPGSELRVITNNREKKKERKKLIHGMRKTNKPTKKKNKLSNEKKGRGEWGEANPDAVKTHSSKATVRQSSTATAWQARDGLQRNEPNELEPASSVDRCRVGRDRRGAGLAVSD